MKKLFVFVMLFGTLVANDSSSAQEAVRDLTDDPRNTKYLSPGGIDSWVLEAEKDEVIIVNVTTNEFDPVVGLARVNENSETVLFSVDDEGSRSQFLYRIKEKGKYKIRIHGFEMKGGGNYDLGVRRFSSRSISIGETIEGSFDQTGQANFYFDATADTHYVCQLVGSGQSLYFDSKGNPLRYDWGQVPVLLTEKDGRHLVSMRGKRDVEYSIRIAKVERASLELGDQIKVASPERALHVWDIEANPGDFRYITVSRSFDLGTRLIYAPTETPDELELNDASNRFAELRYLPVSSKGELTRYAVIFGRKGRYQLQCYAYAERDLNLSMVEPSIDTDFGKTHSGQINIGATDFYRFEAKAGDLIVAELSSSDFDSVLRLHDAHGVLVAENDDSRDTKNSRITHMVTSNGVCRWQIASLGNGGGGDYELSFDNIKLKELEVGGLDRSSLFAGSTEYWAIQGNKDDEVFVNVRSKDFDPIVRIFGPDGAEVDQDDSDGINENSLLALRLPSAGRFTIWVSSHRDGGDYDIRILDAGWGE